MECIKEIQDGYEIIISKRLYEREAIISLAYKYSGRFVISLDSIDSEYVSFSVSQQEFSLYHLYLVLINCYACLH